MGPLTCSGRREVPIFVVFTAEETNSVRLYGIVDSSGEKEKVENLRSNIKEIKDIENEWVVFTGSTRGEWFPRVLEVHRAVTLRYPEEVTYARKIAGKF